MTYVFSRFLELSDQGTVMKKRTSIRRLVILLFLAMIMGASFTCYKDEMDFQTNESNTNSAVRFITVSSSPTSGYGVRSTPAQHFLGNTSAWRIAQSFTVPANKSYYITAVWAMFRRVEGPDAADKFRINEIEKTGDKIIAYIYNDSSNSPTGDLRTSSAAAYIAKLTIETPTYPGDMVPFSFSSRPRLDGGSSGTTYWVVFEILWDESYTGTPSNIRYTNGTSYVDFFITSSDDSVGVMKYENYPKKIPSSQTWPTPTESDHDIIMWVDGITAN